MNKLIAVKSGAAGEYSKYGMSFFEGCVEPELQCTYCYMKGMATRFGMYFGVARLKPWLLNEKNALVIFKNEVLKKIPELRKHGLFFNFSSDPCLPQSIGINIKAWKYLELLDIPVYVLTKHTEWADNIDISTLPKNIIFGVTLTGDDSKENGADKNIYRVALLSKFHIARFKTYTSIEPVIDFDKSLTVIYATIGSCDLYKIGLQSGKKYNINQMGVFVYNCIQAVEKSDAKIYFKESITKLIPNIENDCVVTSDYKL